MAEKWAAAAGKSKTVNRDRSVKRPGRFSPGEILLVFVVITLIKLIVL